MSCPRPPGTEASVVGGGATDPLICCSAMKVFWAKTGDRSYCFVGLWESEEKLVAARPLMIEHLNKVRDYFEELSPELGVTDPVSGSVVTHKS